MGFDQLFDLLDSTERPDWPPYDHGIATRNFRQLFNLADHVKVVSASVEDGMLSIGLVREVPAQLKPRKIEIGKPAPGAANQQGEQKQLSQTSGGQAKAA